MTTVTTEVGTQLALYEVDSTQVGLPALEGLAYSQEKPAIDLYVPAAVDDSPEDTWAWVINAAARMVLLAILVAVAVIAAGVVVYHPAPTLTISTPPVATSVMPPPTETVPVPDNVVAGPALVLLGPTAQQLLSGNELFVSMTTAAGLTYDTPTQAALNAQEVCGYLATHTVSQTVSKAISSHGQAYPSEPAMSQSQASALVSAAIKVYCP